MNQREVADLRPQSVVFASEESRRTIYDPAKILEGLGSLGPWYAHNIITINKEGSQLGKHYHNYFELFFTPTGGFKFNLVDVDTPKNASSYFLEKGQRILLPPRTAHIITGNSESVLLEYGNQEFDSQKLIACDSRLLEFLNSL